MWYFNDLKFAFAGFHPKVLTFLWGIYPSINNTAIVVLYFCCILVFCVFVAFILVFLIVSTYNVAFKLLENIILEFWLPDIYFLSRNFVSKLQFLSSGYPSNMSFIFSEKFWRKTRRKLWVVWDEYTISKAVYEFFQFLIWCRIPVDLKNEYGSWNSINLSFY